MSSDSTLPGTIPVQDSTLKSKLLPNLVIRTPSKWVIKGIIAGIVILFIALISVIVFSIQIQNLIESDAEFERRHISLDQDFEDHVEKFDALENKVSLLVQKIESLTHQLNASGKTFFLLFNINKFIEIIFNLMFLQISHCQQSQKDFMEKMHFMLK